MFFRPCYALHIALEETANESCIALKIRSTCIKKEGNLYYLVVFHNENCVLAHGQNVSKDNEYSLLSPLTEYV